jgi:1,2-diacylglycerol 3-beta-galactosyltransferase
MHADKKRILILTADAGFGHRSAAKALAAALDAEHAEDCVYEVANVLDHEKTPAWLREVQSDYDRIAREAADLYKFTYEASDTALASHMMENAMRVLLYRPMRDIVLRFKPDAIISTYPLYQAPLGALFTLRRSSVPLACVVTDLATVHQIWFSGDADLTIVPTEIVRGLALAAGISRDRLELIGIPVHPRIAAGPLPDAAAKSALRRGLVWREELPALLAVGSKRVGKLGEVLNALNHSGLGLQLAVVAGGDDALYESLGSREWHLPVKLYNFVENMPDLMRASDFVVAKAGGLIVTESLAAGLPLLFVDMIPGQETGNADYVVSGGAGEIAADPVAALEIAYHWLADGGRVLAERAARAAALGRPRAAFDIVDRVCEMADRGCARRDLAGAAAAAAIARLRELFGRFDESCEE